METKVNKFSFGADGFEIEMVGDLRVIADTIKPLMMISDLENPYFESVADHRFPWQAMDFCEDLQDLSLNSEVATIRPFVVKAKAGGDTGWRFFSLVEPLYYSVGNRRELESQMLPIKQAYAAADANAQTFFWYTPKESPGLPRQATMAIVRPGGTSEIVDMTSEIVPEAHNE